MLFLVCLESKMGVLWRLVKAVFQINSGLLFGYLFWSDCLPVDGHECQIFNKVTIWCMFVKTREFLMFVPSNICCSPSDLQLRPFLFVLVFHGVLLVLHRFFNSRIFCA